MASLRAQHQNFLAPLRHTASTSILANTPSFTQPIQSTRGPETNMTSEHSLYVTCTTPTPTPPPTYFCATSSFAFLLDPFTTVDRATVHTVSNQLRAFGPTVDSIHGRAYTAVIDNPPVHGYSIREQQRQVCYSDFLFAAEFSRRQIAILESQISGHHEFLRSLDKLPLTRTR